MSLDRIANGGGDFSKKIIVDTTDEIGQLAKSFNGLMDNLAEKTNDLVSMMSNMHQGLFTITMAEKIHKEHSLYIEKIFNTQDVVGRYFMDLLFEHANLGSNSLNQIKEAVSCLLGADELMFDFNKHLLVTEYEITLDGARKVLELDWDPIVLEGAIDKIMVTVRDVTAIKAMQIEAEAQKNELSIIGQILKASPEKFSSFYENAKALVKENKAIIDAAVEKGADIVAKLFVNMHTIKGNARTYNFTLITDPVHEAENIYDRLRKEEEFPWNPAQLLADLERVNGILDKYAQVKSDKLSYAHKDVQVDSSLMLVSRQMYHRLADALESDSNGSIKNVGVLIRAMDATPFEKVVEGLIGSLPSIANQIDKEPPIVSIDTPELMIRNEFCAVINDVSTHLFRNAIDHGIETKQERQDKGKSPEGQIHIQCRWSEEGAQLTLSDDGRGLNIKRIKEKALESQLLSSEEIVDVHKIAECLFLSGVSTAQAITAISGRGVGMDAVRRFLRQHGADIQVRLNGSADSNVDFLPFKLIIDLPASMVVRLKSA